MSKETRVRLAPSPTGDPHVGTIYQALFNYVFAKKNGGKFILRIEDTDRVRSRKKHEEEIFEALLWLGLKWDEGPDIGGPLGPYRQSERFEIYKKYSEELISKGHAYHCFCTKERLDELRLEQQKNNKRTKYDSKCSTLSKDEISKNLSEGKPFVVRMKVPSDGNICKFNDLFRGEIAIDYETVDEQILIKTDGFPTYHLANVVDDHLMEISHIIRGEEWISSAPKHLLLYSYFGWEPPKLCHLPLLRNPDKSKLSKRKNPTSINFYKRLGILPEAMMNFLGLMSYSMPDEREMFSIEEMISEFDSSKISLGGPVFDIDKLKWLNGKYIREKMSNEELLERLKNWVLNDEFLLKLMPHAKPRLSTFSDFIPLVSFLFRENIELKKEDLLIENKTEDELKEIIQIAIWEIEKLETWETNNIFTLFKSLSEKFNLKTRLFFRPFFVAITGQKDSISLFDSMVLLGKEMTRARLIHALNSFGEPGISKKMLKKIEKKYNFLMSGGAI
jgi:glutamyl-tRNA synthetase